MTRERIILTGASGTLGYNLATQLAASPKAAVLCLQRAQSEHRLLPTGIAHQHVDFNDKAALREAVETFGPDCVIHCAASGTQFPKPDWFELVRFNVNVTLDLCECASLMDNCNFVYISTGLAYRDQGRALREDDPLDTLHPYGASKAAADLLVRAAAAEFGVPLTVVRPFSFTGIADNGSRLFPALLRAVAEQRPMNLSPGDQVRDHCAVQDIAAGVLAAAFYGGCSPQPLTVFNLGSGDTTPLRALIERVVAELGIKVELNFGVRDYARFEPHFMVADAAQAHTLLGWHPRVNLAYAVWELACASFPSLKPLQPPAPFHR